MSASETGDLYTDSKESAADARLRSRRFRIERQADWKALEKLLNRVEGGRLSKLSDEEILLFPRVYQSTLSALSVARETSLDRELVDYLESLCTRAYFYIYGVRGRLGERLLSFFRQDWPRAVASIWRETIVSIAVMLLGAAMAFILVGNDPDWYYSIVPGDLASGRDPSADTDYLRETLYDGEDQDGLSIFATFLFTHNSQVAIFAFALGFAVGLPSILLMFYNGAILGAFMSLYVSRGLGTEMGGWLLIHGVTELFAIALAGAAGIRIGWSIVFAGDKTRLNSLAEAGRQTGLVIAGVIIMLFFAGLLEGFGRQMIQSDLTRYTIAGVSALFWILYFYGRGQVKQ